MWKILHCFASVSQFGVRNLKFCHVLALNQVLFRAIYQMKVCKDKLSQEEIHQS